MTVSKFYDLEAPKIAADGEKIELFTKHPGTLGAFREARLRQYLVEHVPNRLAGIQRLHHQSRPREEEYLRQLFQTARLLDV